MPYSRLKIFLVENHDDTLTYLARYLRNCGHEVQSTKNMTGAIQAITSTDFDLLISDIGLPDGDGGELMRQIGESKSKPPFAIAMSGHNTRSAMEKNRLAGYQHHLVKPFLPEELDVIIEKVAAGTESTNRCRQNFHHTFPCGRLRFPSNYG